MIVEWKSLRIAEIIVCAEQHAVFTTGVCPDVLIRLSNEVECISAENSPTTLPQVIVNAVGDTEITQRTHLPDSSFWMRTPICKGRLDLRNGKRGVILLCSIVSFRCVTTGDDKPKRNPLPCDNRVPAEDAEIAAHDAVRRLLIVGNHPFRIGTPLTSYCRKFARIVNITVTFSFASS